MAQVKPNKDTAAARVATSHTKGHEALLRQKNASHARWLAGWPIQGAMAIASALALLINGNVDLFLQSVDNGSIATLGTFNNGQAPWNNFLNNTVRPFNQLYPEAGGLYFGHLYDDVSGATNVMTGFYSALLENSIAVLYKNQNPEYFAPGLTLPPGVRLERRPVTTQSSTTIITEGFGELSPHGLRRFRADEYWNKETQLSYQLQPSKPLQAYLATLTSQLTPPAGSIIAWIGYGVELRVIQTGV